MGKLCIREARASDYIKPHDNTTIRFMPALYSFFNHIQTFILLETKINLFFSGAL